MLTAAARWPRPCRSARWWGTVGALSLRPGGLPEDAETRVGKFGNLVGLAIASAAAREELTRLAETDPLTGLANRRAFEARLEAEVLHARRTGAPLSVAVLDLDHFKEVNDRHGHEEGDRTLRTLAARMRSATRASDVIARVGGEEFAWLLPATTAEGARALAERLRRIIADWSRPASPGRGRSPGASPSSAPATTGRGCCGRPTRACTRRSRRAATGWSPP